jgi:RNA polymerase sigma factor for flagellar operon FliA
VKTVKAEISKYQNGVDTDQEFLNAGAREERILKYAPLVKFIANRMAVRLPSHISKEDLTSAGIVGLLDALDKFNPKMGIKFKTYAEHRIRGAILDELRKMDWIPRSVRKEIHRIEDAITMARAKLGREPEDFEVAEELCVDINTYHAMIGRARGVGLLSLEAIMPDSSILERAEQTLNTPSPFDELKIKELKKMVAKALSKLSMKEQTVMSLYYYDDMTLKEIAQILGLTESRISQIHSKVIITLRTKLKDSEDDF